ncbi:MAG: nucleotidyltransferase family protein [Lachnospiraceae bacterium]|nr:nucleotidyltransferase family protein [Lachnospiraceae bacterium]
MNSVYNSVLALTRSGLTDTPLYISISPSDWESIIEIAEWQGLLSVFFRAVRVSHVDDPGEYLTRLKHGFFQDVRKDRFQRSELTHLFQVFEESGIDYFPVKGAVMKPLYPDPVYRWMSDADIYVRDSQYERISEIMQREGYSFISEKEHEIKWKKSGFLIELHKSAAGSKYQEAADYFGDFFGKAVCEEGSHAYRFEETEELVYAVFHFAKHYLIGSARLRSLMDLYYLWQRGGEDEEQLQSALGRLKLDSFYCILKRTVLNWFNGVPLDEAGELIIQNVLSETHSSERISRMTNESAREGETDRTHSRILKMKDVLRQFFAPYRLMRKRFPILQKAPFLLPAFWAWRGAETVLFHRKRLKQYMDARLRGAFVEDYVDEVQKLGLGKMAFGQTDKAALAASGQRVPASAKKNWKQAAGHIFSDAERRASASTKRNSRKHASEPLLPDPRQRTLAAALAGDASFAGSAGILTENMDADKENSLYLLSLAIVGYQQGWRYFPQEVIPRLRGIHRYYQVTNSAAAPWFRERLRVLKQAGIPALLTGGTAMRAYYLPDTPRMMNGYDVTVPSGDYERAVALLRDSVYSQDTDNPFARTMSGRTIVRLHKGVPDARLFSEGDFWAGAKPALYLEQEVFVPSSSDMLMHLLCIPYVTWLFEEDPTDRVRRLAESAEVIKGGVSFEKLAETAKSAGLGDVVRYYLVALDGLFPNIIHRDEWMHCFPETGSYRRFVGKLDRLGRISRRRERRDILVRLSKRSLRKYIETRRAGLWAK